ncbi:DUF3080 domain-containing protein [Photobacterium leiognathi]|uniref:DUF3080 domain-containing protein n=1 Tax=Photobacterium leiognathi TaxID=553611 RepID=UPI002980C7D1|nr:DUF3080 domain-containing protein [Photobacterium leiognathi]
MPNTFNSTLKTFTLALGLVLLLAGCKQNSSEAAFNNYHQRLTNVLDIDPTPIPNTDVLPLPQKRDLNQALPDIRIGLLDAYELRQCGLFQLIAERNSILGKVQDKTRSLQYELLFLNGLSYCLTQLKPDSDLVAELTPIYQQKQQQLPMIFWNMIFTGEEWRKQLTLGHELVDSEKNSAFLTSLSAFSYVADLINNNVTTTPTPIAPALIENKYQDLLHHQQQIYNSRYIGDLFYSLSRTTTWLTTITAQLNANQDLILCGNNMNQQKAKYLRNVFYKFYVADIQRYLAHLDSQYQQIQPVLQQIHQQLNQAPIQVTPDMQGYIDAYINGETYRQFHQATLDHVKFWQRLFKQCNFKVGQ